MTYEKKTTLRSGVQFKTGDYEELDYIEADNESQGEKLTVSYFALLGMIQSLLRRTVYLMMIIWLCRVYFKNICFTG